MDYVHFMSIFVYVHFSREEPWGFKTLSKLPTKVIQIGGVEPIAELGFV